MLVSWRTSGLYRAASPDTHNSLRDLKERPQILHSILFIEPNAALHSARVTKVLSGSMFSSISEAMAEFYTLQFELGQFREVPCPGVYLAPFQHA